MNAFSDGFRTGYNTGYHRGIEVARRQIQQCDHNMAHTFLMGSAAEKPLVEELERREGERQKAIEREQINASAEQAGHGHSG